MSINLFAVWYVDLDYSIHRFRGFTHQTLYGFFFCSFNFFNWFFISSLNIRLVGKYTSWFIFVYFLYSYHDLKQTSIFGLMVDIVSIYFLSYKQNSLNKTECDSKCHRCYVEFMIRVARWRMSIQYDIVTKFKKLASLSFF
jgi:hypothetical protein